MKGDHRVKLPVAGDQDFGFLAGRRRGRRTMVYDNQISLGSPIEVGRDLIRDVGGASV